MSNTLPPLLLRPHYVLKPWGGRRLEQELGREDLPSGNVGESWEAADTDAHVSVVEGGPHAGQTLRAVRGRPFPLLLKVLDAREDLSVQVHPDGRDGAPAKEEAWVALASGGAVAVGDVASLATAGPDALPASGAWLSHLCRRELVCGPLDPEQTPTLVHVPPGTVHCIRAGALLFEVQNPVDVTWRLDDYGRPDADGRPRDLHREAAQAVLARGAPAPSALTQQACHLAGRAFSVTLHAPSQVHAVRGADAAFFLATGRIGWGEAEAFDVPRGRTVILPSGPATLRSSGWIVTVRA